MRVLLTGGSGFVGRYVLKALQHQGIEVVTVGRVRAQPSVPFIEADLLSVTDFGPLVQQAQATHLLHLAWYAEHGKYWTSPLKLRWAEATTRLVEAFCAAGGQQVVHDQHPLAGFERVVMDFHHRLAIFQRIGLAQHRAGQLALLADRHEAHG